MRRSVPLIATLLDGRGRYDRNDAARLLFDDHKLVVDNKVLIFRVAGQRLCELLRHIPELHIRRNRAADRNREIDAGNDLLRIVRGVVLDRLYLRPAER